MLGERKTYEGRVEFDVYGPWKDCDPGLYLDTHLIETLVQGYEGKTVRLTIEVIEEGDE